MDPRNLNERLLAHYVRGAWRAPLSTRMLAPGVVAADAADAARARAGLQPGSASVGAGPLHPDPELRSVLTVLRHCEGFDDTAGDRAAVLPDLPPGTVLLSAASTPVALLIRLLAAGQTRGLIWKPAPGAARSACVVMDALAETAGHGLAMVQGDHASGALVAARAPVLWASAEPAPRELNVVFSLSATAPRLR